MITNSHSVNSIASIPFLAPEVPTQMPNPNPRRRPASPPPAAMAMDPQVTIGTRMSQIDDPETMDLGMNLFLMYVYDSLPDPPVSPAAQLPLSGALWIHDGVDRISRLPDEVLRNIVSRLPVKDAARTAAFSSRWRPIWRSAPLTLVDSHLLPDCGASGPLVAGAPSPRAVTAAVSRVLAAHPGPFRCVHLTCTNMDQHRGEMARWLDVLAAKGVLELVFVNRPWPVDLRLPTTIFNCASLTRLYLGLWRLPETAAVPRRASFPNLRELGLCFNVMQDRDLAFMLERSPALEILVIIANQTGLRLRLVSHSLRCVELGCAYLDDIVVEDAPRLERLFQWTTFGDLSEGNPNICQHSRIQIGHAPNLRVLGYLQPRENEMEITNTVVLAGTKHNIVPSVQVFAMEVPFGVRNAVKKVPAFLRCFPNIETLHVQSEKRDETTGKVNLKFWQEGGPIKCVLSMKKLFFYEFRGSRSEVTFLKFIAERARALEKMVVVVAGECLSSGDDVNAKLKSLTGAKWMNKACKLELFKSPHPEVASPVFCHELASDFSFPDPFDLGYYAESL